MLKRATSLLIGLSLILTLSSADKQGGIQNHVQIGLNSSVNFPLEVISQDGENLAMSVNSEGVLHLGTSLNRNQSASNGYLLYVEKGIRTERVKVDVAGKAGWADYVFDEDYPLMSLEDLEAFIEKENHLPGVPSTDVVLKEGMDLAKNDRILLEKIEELSLHIIALNKRIEELEKK